MPLLSYWEKDTFYKDLDVAIIGSGIVGLTSAIYLKKASPDLKVAILERGTLPIGASTRNAGFACFGCPTELLDDLDKRSEKEVFELVDTRWRGLIELRSLVGDQNLRYIQCGGYEIFSSEDIAIFERCLDNLGTFNKYLLEITGQENVYTIHNHAIRAFGFQNIVKMIRCKMEGQLHPGSMIQSLLRLVSELNIPIFNGINIEHIETFSESATLTTNEKWKISSKKVLVATNGFARQLFPEIELWPARNQVLVTQPVNNLPFNGCFHYDKGYFYFRNVVTEVPGYSRILLGGGRNLFPESENTSEFGFTGEIQEVLLKMLTEVVYPHGPVKVDHWWSGILGTGNSKHPILKMVNPNVAVAVRLGGMGIAIGAHLGKQATALLLDQI